MTLLLELSPTQLFPVNLDKPLPATQREKNDYDIIIYRLTGRERGEGMVGANFNEGPGTERIIER
jgi:hypothetical protein